MFLFPSNHLIFEESIIFSAFLIAYHFCKSSAKNTLSLFGERKIFGMKAFGVSCQRNDNQAICFAEKNG
jgi:hypothetical protein